MNIPSLRDQLKDQFMAELDGSLPHGDMQIRTLVAAIFSDHGNNQDSFTYFIHAQLVGEYEPFKTTIIDIAAKYLPNHRPTAEEHLDRGEKRTGGFLEAPKPKRQCLVPLSPGEQQVHAAKEFLARLLKEGNASNCLKDNVAGLMALLSSENVQIVRLATDSLAQLVRFKSYTDTLICKENLFALMLLLEEFAKKHIHPQPNTAPIGPESQALEPITALPSRILRVLTSWQDLRHADVVANMVDGLTVVFCGYLQANDNPSCLSAAEFLILMDLLQTENEDIMQASLLLLARTKGDFLDCMQENLEKILARVAFLLETSKNVKLLEALAGFLFAMSSRFEGISSDAMDRLLTLLLSVTSRPELEIVHSICSPLRHMTKPGLLKALEQRGGLAIMFNLIQVYSPRYLAATAFKEGESSFLEHEEKQSTAMQMEHIILSAAFCMGKLSSSSLEATTAQRVCDVLIAMLHLQSTKCAVFAACELGKLSKTSQERFQNGNVAIGLQSALPLLKLLQSENAIIVQAALWGLNACSWQPETAQHILNNNGFKQVQALFLHPKEIFIGEAFLCLGTWIKVKDSMDMDDSTFLQQIALPFLKEGKHLQPTLIFLQASLQKKSFPQHIAKEALPLILSHLKSKEDSILTGAYWCLGRLAILNLNREIYQAGVLEMIQAIFDGENTRLIEGACFCFCKIKKHSLIDETERNAHILEIARLLDNKFDRVKETALWYLQEVLEMPEFNSSFISLLCFDKIVNLLGHANENIAKEAMLVFEKICTYPHNHVASAIQTAIDHLKARIANGSDKNKILAWRNLEALSYINQEYRLMLAEKGVLELVGALYPSSPAKEILLSLIASLSSQPELIARIAPLLTPQRVLNALKSTNKKAVEAILTASINTVLPLPANDEKREEMIDLIFTHLEDEAIDMPNLKKQAIKFLAGRLHNSILDRMRAAGDMSKQRFFNFLAILSEQNGKACALDLGPWKFATGISMHKGRYQPNVENKFSDIALKVDKSMLFCHKVVLADYSEYFDKLFTSTPGSNTMPIEIQADSISFNKLIQFLYDHEYYFTSVEDAFSMLEVAQEYLVPSLEAGCISFLMQQLSNDNVEEIFEGAISLNSMKLKTDIMYWMMQHHFSLPEALRNWIEEGDTWKEFYSVILAKRHI